MSGSQLPRDAVREIVLRVPTEREDEAVAALAEHAPEGFRQEVLESGLTEFGVYVPHADADLARQRLAAALEANDHDIRDVPGDWETAWKAFHVAIIIGRLWVGPPWLLPAPAGLTPVVIEPGHGFGTGAHATTRMVLQLLSEQTGDRRSILDVGCGSGVLAIAAAALGHSSILAIDVDPLAIISTRDNIARNHTERSVEVRELDALHAPLPRADLVLANLTLRPLVALAPRMTGDRIIASGLLRSQVEEASHAFEAAGYVVRERRDRDGWVALVLDRAVPAELEYASGGGM